MACRYANKDRWGVNGGEALASSYGIQQENKGEEWRKAGRTGGCAGADATSNTKERPVSPERYLKDTPGPRVGGMENESQFRSMKPF